MEKYLQIRQRQLNQLIKSQDVELHRVLDLCEDIMLSDPNFGLKSQVDEILWKYFYGHFETIKQDLKASKETFHQELDFATSFYQMLILNLTESFQDERIGKASRLIVYKSLYFLGDIARYRAQYSPTKSWLEPWIWYEKAFTLHPIGPKPHTQIAILSIYKQNQIDVIYYNSLAMGNIKSSLIPKEHLKSYLQEYSDISIPRSTANFQYFIESTVRLFSNLYTGEFLADLVDFITMLSKNIEFMVFQDLVIVSKLMTSFIILHQELDDRFETISEAMMKQKIRNCQVVCFAFMLLVAKRCLDILDEQLKQPEAIVTIECAVPVGNLCTFLQLRKSTIQQYTSYGSLLSEEFEKLLYGFARSLVVFVNCISAFADMDGSTEYCISDIHLIALKAFTPFFDDILNSNRTVVADLRLTQYARIGHFTQDCANDPEINFISFQKHESKFIVKDSMTKKKDMQRAMKILAEQRLQDQVAKLSSQLGEFKNLQHPVYCLDTDLYQNMLGAIKSCLMSQSCTILVSMEVIRGLDKGKSGSETRNVKSREAIRYLEQRFLYPTPYLYGQRPEEVIQVENVPKGFLGIISCCKYFVQDLENTGCEFFLVTDDAELALIAKEHSINVLGSVDWSSKFK